MEHLFIKKENDQDGFSFCLTSNDGFNHPETPIDMYCPADSSVQCISNKKFLIFYSHMYRLEASFIKMFLEDTLKEYETLSIETVVGVIIPDIKDLLKGCYRITDVNCENSDDREKMTGDIIIVSQDHMFHIYNNFYVRECFTFLDARNVKTLVTYEILGKPHINDLLEFYIKDYTDNYGHVNYPILYGSFSSDSILIRHANGEKKYISKEDFICQW